MSRGVSRLCGSWLMCILGNSFIIGTHIMTTKTRMIEGVFTPTLLYQSKNSTLTSQERPMLTTRDEVMRCLRKAAGKTRMDQERSHLTASKHATSRANKNKIRWWSHVKRMAPTAPMIQPVGSRPRGRPQNRWEDDIPKWYKQIGIPNTSTTGWRTDVWL